MPELVWFGHHSGGSGGCARDNKKGVEESLSVCACACDWLAVLGGSFNSVLITDAIDTSEMLTTQKH